MSERRQQKLWAESSDEGDNGTDDVKKFEDLTRTRALNWADSSDESEDIADEDSDDEDSTSSEEDDVDKGSIRPEQAADMSVQGSVGAGPKPIEQMSKKERKVLKEKELEDLDDLLGEFGVTLDKPQETNDVKVDPSNGVQIENANSIVKEGASQRENVRERENKVKRKAKKEAKQTVQENKELKGNGGNATVAQPLTAVLKSRTMTGRKKPTKLSVASIAARNATASSETKRKKEDKKERKKHYNQNPAN